MAEAVRILSIDGGGIRGIIPALVCSAIEDQAGEAISDLFDLIVGTSTGGILALGLTIPGGDGTPAFAAADLVGFYATSGRQVFPGGGPPTLKERLLGRGDTFRERLNNAGQAIGGPFGGNPRFAGNARYSATGLESALHDSFGAVRISDALTEVAVTTYDSNTASPVVFTRWDALAHQQHDIRMADAARATSAAPTFFPPLDLKWGGRACRFVDGGVWANNPSAVALAESLRMTEERSLTGTSVLLVSLGTGQPPPTPQFDPVKPWLSTVGDFVALGVATSDAHCLVERALGPHGAGRYWRFQVTNPALGGAMDDPTPQRLTVLRSAADELIRAERRALKTLVSVLN